MKTIFHSFLYCCLLASVAHCVELEVNPVLKKRLSIWLGSRLRRDLESVAVEKTTESESFVRPEDIRDTLLPHSSTDIKIRTKRSKGCVLGTCTVHDLAHRLQQLNNKKLKTGAPIDKMSPQGYGRRRRSVPERQLSLKVEKGRLRPVWRLNDSQVHKLEALLRRT
ncbi:adrenomedullin a [Cyprinodon tularosa]|uniref:Adrenomedullin a n=1 Tax=Cyprinodon variegatus TaxID=28743 RepID=A0A3Q2D916_CYPVA|nr:PREDICTED: ADM [Cyprinodon variegatus]XP_038153639.1 adrenomedullin a [Cyprinodon tularosa]